MPKSLNSPIGVVEACRLYGYIGKNATEKDKKLARERLINFIVGLERAHQTDIIDRRNPRKWKILPAQLARYAPELSMVNQELTEVDALKHDISGFIKKVEERVTFAITEHPIIKSLEAKIQELEDLIYTLAGKR